MAGIDLSLNFGNTESQSKAVTRAVNDYLKSTGQANNETEKLEVSVKKTTKVMPAMKNGLNQASTAVTNFGKSAATAASRFGGLSGIIGTLVAGTVIRKAVNDFVALDKGLIGVSKTTGITGKALDDFQKQITNLSKEVPVARDELLAIAQSAGQLGVTGSANILKFTKTVAQLGTASDLAGEEAATTLARMLTVAGETADQVDVLGSAIVALGNNMAATESEIARVAMQVGQATAEFGVSSTQAAAFGAALRSIGVQAELGGSAVGRTFRAIRKSIDDGGESFRDLQKITGIAGDQLKQTFEKDSTKVFQKFVEGLGKIIKSGGTATNALDKFGLKGEEILKVIPTIALRNEELARALSIAATEQENATALTLEAQAAGGSYAAQLQVLDNRMTEISSTVGKELLPVIIELSSKFADFIEGNKDDVSELAQNMGSLASSTGDLLSKVLSGFNSLPDSIKSVGLFGSIFFGAKGAALFAGFSILYDWADTADKAISRVLEGSMSFSDFAMSNGEELRDMLKLLEEETTNLSSQAAILRSKEARSIYQEDKDYYSSEAEKLELKISQIKQDQLKKDALAAINSFENVASKQIEIQKKASAGSFVPVIDEEKITTEKGRSVEDPFTKRKLAEEKSFQDAVVKLNADARDKINKKNKDYLDKAKELDGRSLLEKRDNLKKEWEAVRDLSTDKLAVDKKYAAEYKKIEDEIRKKSLSEWEKWGEKLKDDVIGSFVNESKNMMSDVLFDGIRGDLDDFGSYWDNAWKGLLRTFTDTIAKMASEKIVGTAVNWAVDAIFAKDGLWEVETDEQPVVAHEGEMVVPKAIATKLRKVSSESSFAALDNAIDPTQTLGQAFGVSANDFALGDVAGSRALSVGLKDMRTSLTKSGAKLATASMIGNVSMGDILNSGFGANALMSAGGAGVIGGLKSYAGLSGSFASAGGTAGTIASALLGMAAGGPLGLMASSAMGLVGSALGDAFGDLTDARNMEVFRDYLEDKKGYFPGRNLSTGILSGSIDPASLSFEDLETVIGARNAQLTANRNQVGTTAFGSFVESISSFLTAMNPFTYLSPALSYISSLWSNPNAFDADSYNLGAVDFGLATGLGYSTGLGGYSTKATKGYGVSSHIEAARDYESFASTFGTDKAFSSINLEISKNLGINATDVASIEKSRASSYNAGSGWSTVGGQYDDWSTAARTNNSGSSYSGGSGRGHGVSGFARGGVVNQVLAANPQDDGFAPLKLKEGVVSVPGMEALERINNGEIGGGTQQVIINLVTSTGQQLKQFVVDTVRDGTERGIATIHVDGLYGGVNA